MPRWRRRKVFAAKGMRAWPAQAASVTTEKVVELYGQGFAGTIYDPEAEEQLFSSQPFPDGEQAAYDFGLVGSGAGKLTLAYLPAYAHWPKCWPCPGQETGDCVSHGGKNSALVLIGAECDSGQPDPSTGVIEGWPVVTAEAEQQGVVACEPIYGWRGHGGQGASCSRLIEYTCNVGGIHMRQNYPELNIDLTRYTVRLGMNWGRSGTPANVNAEGKKHQIRTATDCQNHEVCRDFLANSYPIWACSSLGWSSSRDQYGFSKQRGSWSHSWNIIAYDDRPDTVSIYGFPWALYIHDWGRWNSGPRDIRDTATMVPAHLKQEWISKGIVSPSTGNLMIPEGSMWIDARLLNRCDCTAMSNFNGFPGRPMTNLLI